MAKKKSAPIDEGEDDIPSGKTDEDGDEILDLDEWTDDLTQNTFAEGDRGVDFNEYIDTISNVIWGYVQVW